MHSMGPVCCTPQAVLPRPCGDTVMHARVTSLIALYVWKLASTRDDSQMCRFCGSARPGDAPLNFPNPSFSTYVGFALLEVHLVQAISVLVALVRGNAEYELSRSAMSLLVTFGKHKEGARQLGQTRGLCHLIAKMLLHREVEMQWLAVELVRVVLTTAAGRAQACSSPKLQTAIQEAEKDNRLGTDGSRQLGMLQREIRFYQRNLLQV
mmetsp:Transcript_12190/g.23266  ORF Transcript_12190/g.23266 Transcript_12190/m.23266 type:complete len:209 (+) Transcript_12190:1295-1921(+)